METIQIIEKAIKMQLCNKLDIITLIDKKSAKKFKGFRNTRASMKGLYLALKLAYEDFPIWLIFSKGYRERPYLFMASQEKHNYVERVCKPNYKGVLQYTFKPTRQDDFNELRNKKFLELFHGGEIIIEFPTKVKDVEDFLLELYRVGKCSILAMEFPDIEKSELENQKNFYTSETELLNDGKQTKILSTKYERKIKNRRKAIEIHGTTCKACGFNFQEYYGERGHCFIEIHHIVPLASLKTEIEVNPVTDLIPLCSNCHRMIHKIKDYKNSLKILKEEVEKIRKFNLRGGITYTWLS